MDTKLLIIFIVLNITNVVIQTIKSILTIKGNKYIASIANAVAYGLYTVVVVYMVCELPLYLKVAIVATCNLIGVFIVKLAEEKTRKDTETWLKQNKVPYSKLFLRKTGDNRRDASVKKEIYNTEILPYYNVNFVLDDRNQVVAMLRELGLTVFQVAEGNF